MENAPALDQLDAALKREIRSAERILWQGRPIARIQMAAFAIWLFAIPWTAFSIFWTGMAYAGSQEFNDGGWGWATLAFPLFGIPFIVVGLGMMAAPFMPLYAAKRTIFAATDSRLIKLRLGRTLHSETVPAYRIGLINRSERRDGSGTLKIATKIGRDSDGDQSVETFDIGEVDQVLKVEQIIRQLAERAVRSKSQDRPENRR